MGAARQNEFFGWVRGTDEGSSRGSLLIAVNEEGSARAGRAGAGGEKIIPQVGSARRKMKVASVRRVVFVKTG
jgi:hypothetical protein